MQDRVERVLSDLDLPLAVTLERLRDGDEKVQILAASILLRSERGRLMHGDAILPVLLSVETPLATGLLATHFPHHPGAREVLHRTQELDAWRFEK